MNESMSMSQALVDAELAGQPVRQAGQLVDHGHALQAGLGLAALAQVVQGHQEAVLAPVAGQHRGDRDLHRHRAALLVHPHRQLGAPDAVGQHRGQHVVAQGQPLTQVQPGLDAAVVAGQAHQGLVDLQHHPLRVDHGHRVAGAGEGMRHQPQRLLGVALGGHVLQRAQHLAHAAACVAAQGPAAHPQPARAVAVVQDAEAHIDVGMRAAQVQLPRQPHRRPVVAMGAVEELLQRHALAGAEQRQLRAFGDVDLDAVGGGVPFPDAFAAGPQGELQALLGRTVRADRQVTGAHGQGQAHRRGSCCSGGAQAGSAVQAYVKRAASKRRTGRHSAPNARVLPPGRQCAAGASTQNSTTVLFFLAVG
ncbi:MAG TPA: hypothetical protein PKL46_16980 [Aquabacterium sp.]|nr:hypothetical protein [Aquabacterium sp.]